MENKLVRAIKASISHWKKDILEPLQEGQKIISGDDLRWKKHTRLVKCYGYACPLCAYQNDSKDGCYNCLLTLAGKCCNHPSSSWTKFISNPGIRTAKAMIKTLESLLIESKEKRK